MSVEPTHPQFESPFERSTVELPAAAPSADEPVAPVVAQAPRFPRLSPVITWFAGTILLFAGALFLWLMWSSAGLGRVTAPDAALHLLASRSLDLQDAMAQAPRWEQVWSDWTSGDSAAERAELLRWYEELVTHLRQEEGRGDAQVELQLAILRAEVGHTKRTEWQLQSWDRRPAPFPMYARLVQVAYANEGATRGELKDLQAIAVDALPAGWFYERVAMRLATRAGDESLMASITALGAERRSALLNRSRVLTVIQLVCIVVGLFVVVRIVRRGTVRPWLLVGRSTQPPPWPGWLGVHVLIRGAAVGAAVMWLAISFGVDHPLLRLATIPATNVALLWFAWRCLIQPLPAEQRDVFGLVPLSASGRRLAAAVFVLVAAGLLGEWVLGRLGETLGLTSHWSEWFDGDLVWGAPAVVATSVMEYVILAPIFEELAFRGLLFSTLRRRWSFRGAAFVSAGLFALAHGYGILGFLGVFWSGLLWAWSAERTGSLLPGMIAHAINNLFVCLGVLALLRW